MRINLADLNRLRTRAGGYTRSTLDALGIDWPPTKGWKQTLIGKEISEETWGKAVRGLNRKKT